MPDQVLHLVVPGLLGPMSRLEDMGAGRRFRHIEHWLARARANPVVGDGERVLFELFGLTTPEDADLPTAAVSYLGETGTAPPGVVYHATPVHLRPDQDRLLLFDIPPSDLSVEEGGAIVSALNTHFAADGWRFEITPAGNGYLHVEEQPALRTRPLGDVIGRNVDLFLPEGADAPRWRQRLNEVQMLLHGLAANDHREAQGKVAVNSLWLHGGGALPAAGTGPGPEIAGAASELISGLTQLCGTVPEAQLQWMDAPRQAVWHADPEAWLAAVTAVDERLPAVPVDTVLYPGDGRAYRLPRFHRLHLWRRLRPLLSTLLPESID